MRQTLLLVLLALLSTTIGCGKFRKTKECNAFIDKVNGSVKEIERLSAAKGEDDAQIAGNMRKIGELWDTLAKDVGAIDITTPDLKKNATEYQGMCTRAATTARAVATALENKNADQGVAAQKEFDKVVKEEDELVNKINTYCQAP
jgi:hypothetical protein